jgi:anti-sigma regulatory factor (Ser/Thr protein kinase)
MKDGITQVSLKTRLDPRFLRLVTSFAEESAKAFGLDTTEALKLTLACEEVFAYLCGVGRKSTTAS